LLHDGRARNPTEAIKVPRCHACEWAARARSSFDLHTMQVSDDAIPTANTPTIYTRVVIALATIQALLDVLSRSYMLSLPMGTLYALKLYVHRTQALKWTHQSASAEGARPAPQPSQPRR
jgi:hypothetical protein